jgi:hypothetical protein
MGIAPLYPSCVLPDEYWEAVLKDPRAAGRPALPTQQRRLSEIPREVLRVECARCSRCVEIRTLDAVRLFGPHAVWKDVAQRLLDNGCQLRTGRHERMDAGQAGHEETNTCECAFRCSGRGKHCLRAQRRITIFERLCSSLLLSGLVARFNQFART